MHYILRNVSVRPHQISHRVKTFYALLRNSLICIALLNVAYLHLSFLSDRFKCLMFLQIFIFPQIFDAPV